MDNQHYASIKDGTSATGRFGFGAATNGTPPAVTFDNIIATTPGGGQ